MTFRHDPLRGFRRDPVTGAAAGEVPDLAADVADWLEHDDPGVRRARADAAEAAEARRGRPRVTVTDAIARARR